MELGIDQQAGEESAGDSAEDEKGADVSARRRLLDRNGGFDGSILIWLVPFSYWPGNPACAWHVHLCSCPLSRKVQK